MAGTAERRLPAADSGDATRPCNRCVLLRPGQFDGDGACDRRCSTDDEPSTRAAPRWVRQGRYAVTAEHRADGPYRLPIDGCAVALQRNQLSEQRSAPVMHRLRLPQLVVRIWPDQR